MAVKRVLITAGGTGGHLYPAQALAEQCLKHDLTLDILFVAGGLSKNRCFDRQRFAFREITCSPLLSKNPMKSLKGLWNLGRGIKQSIQILRHYQPNVIVGFGSYYTVPILLAARLLKIPIILHEANSVPGKANQWLARLATYIGLHFPSTAQYFKKQKCFTVGLPLREGFQRETIKKEQALTYYGLSTHQPVLLIFGGSQGAQAINLLIKKHLFVLKQLSLQVVHLTGNAEMTADLQQLYAHYQIPACVKDFEHQMQMAWKAADTFIGRAGASTVAESIEFEVPGILIPYPYAGQHQEKNADFLVDQVKSAWKLLESQMTSDQFNQMVQSIHQPKQLNTFKQAIQNYKTHSQQMTLTQLVLNIHSLEGGVE